MNCSGWDLLTLPTSSDSSLPDHAGNLEFKGLGFRGNPLGEQGPKKVHQQFSAPYMNPLSSLFSLCETSKIEKRKYFEKPLQAHNKTFPCPGKNLGSEPEGSCVLGKMEKENGNYYSILGLCIGIVEKKM